MLLNAQYSAGFIASPVEHIGVAISLLIELGLLGQHGTGQIIDLLFGSGCIGYQRGRDGKGGGGFQVARIDTSGHLAALVIPDTLDQLVTQSAIDRQKQIELAKARNLPHPIGYNYKAEA